MSLLRSLERIAAPLVVAGFAACSPPVHGEPPPAPPPGAPPPEVDVRATRPPAGPAPAFLPPRIEEARLDNGMRVLVSSQRGLPVVFVRIVFDGGAASAGPGVVDLVGDMLMRGTRARSAAAIADELARLGADSGVDATYDSLEVSARCLRDRLPEVLTLLSDVVAHPAFAKDEIERERSRHLTKIGQRRESAARVAFSTLYDVLYPPGHPYATPVLGNEESVKKADARALAAVHRAIIVPSRATLVLAGDVELQRDLASVTRAFGDWKGGDRASPASSVAADVAAGAKAPVITLVDRPGATQSHVLIGAVGVARSTPDYDALTLMNAILGSWQLSNRLYVNLRERHGYTYGAGSELDMRRGRGPFDAEAALVREHTREGISEMLAELARMRTERVGAEELEATKAALVRGLPASFETAEATARTIAELAVYGLPLDEPATRPARWSKVTPEDVQRVAAKYLDPSGFHLVVVGDAKAVRPELERLGLGEVTVRPAPR